MWSVILSGLGLGLFMSISVGPTIFAILRYSIQYGWKAGMSFVLGVSVSDILYVAIANQATSWLAGMMQHANWIGYVGAILFITMGIWGMFKKIKVTRNRSDDALIKSSEYIKITLSGFFMNTLNPGVIITWLTAVAAVSNFEHYSTQRSYATVFFISCLGLVLIFDILKVFLAQTLRKKLTPRKIVYLNRISAFCILALGFFILIKVAFGIKLVGY